MQQDRRLKRWLISGVSGVFLMGACAAQAAYSERAEVKAFINEAVEKHGLDRDVLVRRFADVQRQNKVLEAMSKPAERVLTWKGYRPIFLKEKRIKLGVEFFNKHRAELLKAEKAYGVPAEIIAAIVGVETYYGRYKGKHPAFDTLVTLAFDHPRRGKFFRKELMEYLRLVDEEALDYASIKGSYAAAMGMPQFISSSYRAYAIDFDKDGRRDLWNSIPDVVGSVANYFKRHGWQTGEAIVERTKVNGKSYRKLLKKELQPTLTSGILVKNGIQPKFQTPGKKTLMELKGAKGNEHWIGHKNFYVITRYNHSKLYAMAVFQLSQQIALNVGR